MSLINPDQKEYQWIIPAVVEILPQGCSKVLDVGCSSGALGHYLKKEKNIQEVIGIEYSQKSAQIAKDHLDRVYNENVETFNMPESYDHYFDCIIYADILEHLYHPDKLIQNHLKLLKKGGFILTSIPNIRNLYILLCLLQGRFDYTKTGLLDETHIRFFTLNTALEMFQKNGLKLQTMRRSIRDSHWHRSCAVGAFVNEEILKIYGEVFERYQKHQDCNSILRKYVGLLYGEKESIADFLTVQYHLLFQK